MTPSELLHTNAARYASHRKNAYLIAMDKGEVTTLSEEGLNGMWLAHYEGYREGYWVATGDTKYSTDPARLKEQS
jgi:hypothetical protein